MKKNFFLFLGIWAVCCMVLCSSCTDTAPARVSRLYLLAGDSSKTWHMLSDSSYKGLASNPCLLDNEYVFTTSGEFVSIDKGTPCSAAAEEVRLPWALERDSTVLVFNAQARMRILALDDTSMVVEELSSVDSTAERKTVFRVVR